MSSSMYCPHCSGELPDHHQRGPGRCLTCSLLVGVGRAHTRPDPELISSMSGLRANAAHREDADPLPRDEVTSALRCAAREVECVVERLRMSDYDRLTAEHPARPSVGQVLATFPTWKLARTAAGGPRPGATRASRDHPLDLGVSSARR